MRCNFALFTTQKVGKVVKRGFV